MKHMSIAISYGPKTTLKQVVTTIQKCKEKYLITIIEIDKENEGYVEVTLHDHVDCFWLGVALQEQPIYPFK